MNLEDLRDSEELEFTKLIMKSLKSCFFVSLSFDHLCTDFEKNSTDAFVLLEFMRLCSD